MQWGSTTALLAAGLWVLDTVDGSALWLVAGALALSSTAVALQTINDRGERGTPLARSATALLIFQDVVAVVLLALVGSSAAGESAAGADGLLLSLGKAALALAAVAAIGRAIRPAFAWIVANGLDEAFTAFALLIVVATAGLTGMAGLSLPLGAFLGGMLLSESEYCYMVKSELKPFRGLLLGLFFITVGMSLDAGAIADAFWLTLVTAIALLLLKGLLVGLSARLTGASTALSIRMGFTLAQGSEFAFVVFALMSGQGGLDPALSSILVGAVVISMALTPAIAPLGEKLAESVAVNRTEGDEDAVGNARHVLLNGTGDSELTIARALHETGNAYLALDPDRSAVARARSLGFTAGIGNLEDPQFIEALGETLDVLILGRTETDTTAALVRRLRSRRPGLDVIVRVADEEAAKPLRDLGAVVCVAADDPSDRTLAVETLRYLAVTEDTIARWLAQYDEDPEWETADKAHAAG